MAEESTHHPDPDLPGIYPDLTPKATPALAPVIAREIKQNGPIPFSSFMELALYHPEFGYYSSESQKTGKQGDFITSVSVGSCFGIILARRLHQYWLKQGKPAVFDIIEPGAHDGTLACDILNEVSELSSEFYRAINYLLVESSARLRDCQMNQLGQAHDGKFNSHESMDSIRSAHGAIISNELIDAFPVERIRFADGSWFQQMVTLDDNEMFSFIDTPLSSPELKQFCTSLGTAFPEGYTTEYNTGMEKFVSSASNAIKSGLFLTIDYGHLERDFYHPDRSTGTLQTYHAHSKAEDPLQNPGELDITAHVDFTRLQKSSEAVGFHSPWFGTQASYLTEHAREWLLEMENTPKSTDLELIRQFQTLTHPSMLGSRFSVLEMHK